MSKREAPRIDENTANKIQNLQLLEQNLQNIIMKKQAFNFEAIETVNAMDELKNSSGDIFKIVGSIMLKTNKQDLEENLIKKKGLIEMKIKDIEKQEQSLKEKLLEMREDVIKKIS